MQAVLLWDDSCGRYGQDWVFLRPELQACYHAPPKASVCHGDLGHYCPIVFSFFPNGQLEEWFQRTNLKVKNRNSCLKRPFFLNFCNRIVECTQYNIFQSAC